MIFWGKLTFLDFVIFVKISLWCDSCYSSSWIILKFCRCIPGHKIQVKFIFWEKSDKNWWFFGENWLFWTLPFSWMLKFLEMWCNSCHSSSWIILKFFRCVPDYRMQLKFMFWEKSDKNCWFFGDKIVFMDFAIFYHSYCSTWIWTSTVSLDFTKLYSSSHCSSLLYLPLFWHVHVCRGAHMPIMCGLVAWVKQSS